MLNQRLFRIQRHRRRGHVIVEICGHMVRKPHTLQCRAMTFRWFLLYSLDTDCTENTVTNSSIIARVSFVAETCLATHEKFWLVQLQFWFHTSLSSVGIATDNGLEGTGSISGKGKEFFFSP
jgi:hypothetical protein